MTLVEGVESPEDLFMVLKTRARFVQGFLWPEFAIPAHVNLGLPA
jgi:EAL domain-containing protein (putative c-di-GMP-specific phosphodiesterase class I)